LFQTGESPSEVILDSPREVSPPGPGILSDPLLLEVLVVVLLFAVSALLIRRLLAGAREISRRRSLREYIDGMDAAFAGDHARAIRLLTAVVERDPENVEARILLGDAHRETGDVAEAHRLHYQVLEIFGQDILQNRLSLAEDLICLGRNEDARQHLLRVIEERPLHARALDLLARALDALDRPVDLVRARRSLLAIAEKKASETEAQAARSELARALARAGTRRLDDGDVKRGAPLLQEATLLLPGLLSPRLELVRARLIEGNSRSARKVFRQQLTFLRRRLDDDPDFLLEPANRGESPGSGRGNARVTASLPHPAAELFLGTARTSLPSPVVERSSDAGKGTAVVPGATDEQDDPTGDDLLLPEIDGVAELLSGLLEREAPFVCSSCGRCHLTFDERCAGCKALGTLSEIDRSLLRRIPRLNEVLDELDGNEAHLERLADRIAQGDPDAGDSLASHGSLGFAAALRRMQDGGGGERIEAFLISRGAEALPDLARAYAALSNAPVGGAGGMLTRGLRAALDAPAYLLEGTTRLARGGPARETGPSGPDLATLLTAVFRAMGVEGVSFHRRVVTEDGNPGLRRASLAALLQHGEGEILDELPLVVPAKEILQALALLDEESLAGLLARARPEGAFVREVLTDRTFANGALLVTHLSTSAGGTVATVLARRGFDPEVYLALLVTHARGGCSDALLESVLTGFGPAVVDHLVASILDPATTFATLPALEKSARVLGPACLPKLAESLTGDETPEQERVTRLLLSFGEEAVETLAEQYERAGRAGLLPRARTRATQRKRKILDLLADIRGKRVKRALKPLVKEETDPDLRLRLLEIMSTATRKTT